MEPILLTIRTKSASNDPSTAPKGPVIKDRYYVGPPVDKTPGVTRFQPEGKPLILSVGNKTVEGWDWDSFKHICTLE